MGKSAWLGVVALLVAGLAGIGPAGAQSPRVLRVGSWRGSAGEFTSIQAAVNAARPGDWVLVAPGDYHETGSTGGRHPAGVYVTTRNLHIRGLDRNAVIVDGTRPHAAPCASDAASQFRTQAGRNGIEVYKADGVSIENLTVCNFLTSASGGEGNQIWWNGGDGSGKIGMGPYAGSYLTATTTWGNGAVAPEGLYGIFVSNSRGPGVIAHTYSSNMADSAYYIGACSDCNAVLTDAHAQNSAIGFSGTNAGGHLIIERSTWDNNRSGIVPNVLNNDDAPPPQNGACPKTPGSRGGVLSSGPQPPRCTIIRDNVVFANNNPNTPGSGITAAAPVGTGIELSGVENTLVANNDVHDNGAWGILLHDFPDTSTPPPVAHCEGGLSVPGAVCYFQAFGNFVTGNRLSHNGFFGNPTNGDLAAATSLHAPGNCFSGNTDPKGLTTDPPLLQQLEGRCGVPNAGDLGPLTAEIVCDSGLLGTCPTLPGITYPRGTAVRLFAIPKGLATMPNPCAGVPANPWCPA